VRVRLLRVSPTPRLHLTIDGPYEASDTEDGRVLGWGRRLDDGWLVPEGSAALALNGARLNAVEVRLCSRDPAKAFRVGETVYPGALRVRNTGAGSIDVVSELPLETYLEGVVGAEMPASFPEEALRAQAIAARTYAVYDLLHRSAAAPPGADLDDSVRSQVYLGRDAATPRAVAAVRATRGLVLLSEGRPFRAYFHSTCGGETTDPGIAFGEVRFPPTLRGVHCGACGESPHARWSCRLGPADLEAVAKSFGLAGSGVRVTPETTASGARLRTLRIATDRGERRVTALDFRLAAGPERVRSTWWTRYAMEDGNLVVEGRGWGHGVGLCQYGARARAQAGATASEILDRYYPGATLGCAWPEPADAEAAGARP